MTHPTTPTPRLTAADAVAGVQPAPDPGTDLVSVVIVNYNRKDDVREALRSVERQDHPHVEIIVVDNDSRDGSAEMIRGEFPRVRLIALSDNTGMDGYSVGFRNARGRYAFQMDNDSEMPDPTVLSAVVRAFRDGPEELGVVACRVEDVRPPYDLEAVRRKTDRRGPIRVLSFHSGGVGFRRAALDRAGYYNRDVFLYGSENFVETNLLAAGYTIHYHPEILMLHKGSPAARSGRFVFYTLRNTYWYMRRFATRGQQFRYLPRIMLHHLFDALYKRVPGAMLRAWWQGFGPLPPSLRGKVGAGQPDVYARVEEIGQIYSIGNFFKRSGKAFRKP